MLRYIEAEADVVLDEGNTIKPECADVLHSLTDEARRIQVPGYGLVKMHPEVFIHDNHERGLCRNQII